MELEEFYMEAEELYTEEFFQALDEEDWKKVSSILKTPHKKICFTEDLVMTDLLNDIWIKWDYIGRSYGNTPVLDFTNVNVGNLKLPDLEYIAHFTFSGAVMNKIQFPSNLRVIGSGAFSDARITAEVKFPESLEVIHDSAFYGALKHGGVQNKTLDLRSCKNLRQIDSFAFADNPIDTVILPESITYLDLDAFCRCNLKTLIFAGSKEQFYLIKPGTHYYTMRDAVPELFRDVELIFEK